MPSSCNMREEQLVPRALFGGALEMDIPVRFEDISDFRPVPDHQEVRVCSCLAQHHFAVCTSSAYLAGLDRCFFRPIACARGCGELKAQNCYCVNNMLMFSAVCINRSTKQCQTKIVCSCTSRILQSRTRLSRTKYNASANQVRFEQQPSALSLR